VQFFLLRSILLHRPAQLLAFFININLFQQLFDGLSSHAGFKLVAKFLAGFAVFFFVEQLFFFKAGIAGMNDYIGFKIQNFFQLFDGHIQDETDPARRTLEKPDMSHR